MKGLESSAGDCSLWPVGLSLGCGSEGLGEPSLGICILIVLKLSQGAGATLSTRENTELQPRRKARLPPCPGPSAQVQRPEVHPNKFGDKIELKS